MSIASKTPRVSPRPGRLQLMQLRRSDLEALVSYKLWVEVGVCEPDAEAVVHRASRDWLVEFLSSGPAAVGQAPLDMHVLAEARRRRSDILSLSQVDAMVQAATSPSSQNVPIVPGVPVVYGESSRARFPANQEVTPMKFKKVRLSKGNAA